MTTLVTGAFGCIGSWVVRALLVRGEPTDREALTRVVREHAIDRIIHLAAWQVPLCRQDPPKGALVNVVGTANVFEAARASDGRVRRVVYASSAGVFGPPHLYPPGPLADDAPPHPATHYGVSKVANEETARVYWADLDDFARLRKDGRLDARELA